MELACKTCTEHKCNCHSSCAKYNEWLIEHNKERRMILEKRRALYNSVGYEKQRRHNMATRRKVRVNRF